MLEALFAFLPFGGQGVGSKSEYQENKHLQGSSFHAPGFDISGLRQWMVEKYIDWKFPLKQPWGLRRWISPGMASGAAWVIQGMTELPNFVRRN